MAHADLAEHGSEVDGRALAEVVEAMEGDERPVSNAAKSSPLARALLYLCRELGQVQQERLEAVTLADLVEQAASREPMWYI